MQNITKSFLFFISSYIVLFIPYFLSISINVDTLLISFSYILCLFLSIFTIFYGYKAFKYSTQKIGGFFLLIAGVLPFLLVILGFCIQSQV